MPPNTVKVDRTTPFGNPFRVVIDPRIAVASFERWLNTTKSGIELKQKAIRELRGKNLACWCGPTAPCHAEVLLRVVNDPDAEPAGPPPPKSVDRLSFNF